MGICTVRSVIDIFRWTFLGSGSIPIRVNQLERTYTYSCLWFKRSLDGAFVALLSKRPSRYWPFFVINIISAADRSMRYVGDLEIRLGFTRIHCAWLDRHQPDWPTSGKLKYFNGHHRPRTNIQDTCLANYLLIWMIAILFSEKKHVSFYNIPQMWVYMRAT